MKRLLYLAALLMPLLIYPNELKAQFNQETSIEHSEKSDGDHCKGCKHSTACSSEKNDDANPIRSILWPLPLIIIASVLLVIKRLKLKSFLFFTSALLLILAIQHFWPSGDPDELHSDSSFKTVTQEAQTTHSDEFGSFEENNSTDDFETWDESTDEFGEFEGNKSEDEFTTFEGENTDDEFTAFDPNESTLAVQSAPETDKEKARKNRIIKYTTGVLLLTILAGFLSLFKRTRKLRIPFLLGGLVYMGFYTGGCPCMISSFQDFVLWLFGAEVFWGTMLWFLGLMVITYFFGRVWCGWFCHLGALQEFLYKAAILKPLKSAKAQQVMKVIRNATLIILLAQLAITHTNIFIHYDPFKVAFNLFSSNTLGYILLVVLLLSSIMINRPFCRAFCPVGLAMGWVAKIPGASVLHPDEECIGCKSCNNVCEVGAIVRTEKISMLDNAECIRCGACQDNCKKDAMHPKLGDGTVQFKCIKIES